jgi:hypothetical protein
MDLLLWLGTGSLWAMKRLARWLFPTLIGPVVGAWGYVALAAMLSSLPVPTALWLLAATVAGSVAFGVGALTACIDVVLLRLRLRKPPTGWRAWGMGVAIPFPLFFSWQRLGRWALLGWGYLLLWIVLPMLLTAGAARLLAARKPLHW